MSDKIKNAFKLGIARAVDELSSSGGLDYMAWEAIANIADVIILPSWEMMGQLNATAVIGRKEKILGSQSLDNIWPAMIDHWGKDYVREMLTKQLQKLDQ
ncbi:MAG: hypothetical protein BWY57_02661 [Betaproteobacteria bacterium ADurb.Bin341]|nr:MAG: hypothetical protein BWY57_02661 [Betaproteobacteria bacterium ADurb.Bin341]